MATVLRLSRGGAKNRPFYKLVAADKKFSRDGRFIEKLGTFNPSLAKTNAARFSINEERVKYWLGQGAQPSETVTKHLVKLGLLKEAKKVTALREKSIKRRADAAAKKAAEEAAVAAAAAAEEAAKNAPAPEAPAAEAAPAETPAA